MDACLSEGQVAVSTTAAATEAATASVEVKIDDSGASHRDGVVESATMQTDVVMETGGGDDGGGDEWVMACQNCKLVKPVLGYFGRPQTALCKVCERTPSTCHTYEAHGLLPL